MSPHHEFDLIIVGGGLVGASLAVALRNSGLSMAVVERWPPEHDSQPSYDERTVALTWSSRCIYTGSGIWSDISRDAEPIRDIHVSERGRFGMVHLSHRHAGTAALGYVVPTRSIGNVLFSTMSACRDITLFCPAEAGEIHRTGDRQSLTLTRDEGNLAISAPMVVLADGGSSKLPGEDHPKTEPYQQQALLSIITTDRPHQGRAWERFTREGPLALLPLSRNRLAVVWTCMPDELERRRNLDDESFIRHLQREFGDRAGNLSNPSPRKVYPLGRRHLQTPAQDRMAVLGNAARMVHPVAGQGFNLGLRDVAVLAELIHRAHMDHRDIGSDSLLEEYNRLRRRDSFMVRQFTHGLITLFAMEFPGIPLLRSMGMKGIEMVPPAKRFLLHRTMGLAGSSGVLTRGLSLESPGHAPMQRV